MIDHADWLYATLHGLAAVLAMALLADLVRRRGHGWESIPIGVVLALVGPVAVVSMIDARDIPIDLVTVLHEGTELQSLRHLYAAGVHAGPCFSWLTRLAARGTTPDLRDVVLLNSSLSVVWASGVMVVARHTTRSWPGAVALTLASLLCMPTALAALSELPAVVLGVYLLVGVVAASHLDDRERATRLTDATALALLAVISFLAFATREESLFVSAPAIVVASARVIVGDEALAQRERRALNVLGDLVRGSRGRLVLVLALVFGSFGLLSFGADRVRWVLEALHPLNPTTLTLPVYAAVWLIPTSSVILFVLGVIHGTRSWRTSLLLPASLLALYRLYYSAAHDAPFEILRYLTLLTPGLVLVSLFGVREIARLARRLEWPDGWRPVSAGALALAFAATSAFANPAWLGWDPEPKNEPRHTGFPLDRDLQREVRYLLALRDRFPECVFIAPVTARDSGAVGERREYVLAWFGAGHTAPRTTAAETELALADLARREAPDAACVLAYVGLDCNLEGGDTCDRFRAGALVDERTFASDPYNDPDEYGRHRGEIRLAVHAVVPTSGPSAQHEDQAPRRRTIEREREVEVAE